MESINVESSRCKNSKARKRDPLNVRRRGRIYSRGGKLWVDFRYLGQRVREPSGLDDTQSNRSTLRRQLDLIMAEIGNRVFQFAERFPQSSRKDHFSRLEARSVRKNPQDTVFGDCVKGWWEAMEPGFSEGKARDYAGILENHLRPFFGQLPFSEFKPVVVKKFVAQLKGRQNRYGQPLSAKSIRNYLIPLRVIVRDAMDEYGWDDLRNPFWGVNLPKVRRIRVEPFNSRHGCFFWRRCLPGAGPILSLQSRRV